MCESVELRKPGLYVITYGHWYHQRQCQHQGSRPPPGAMLVSESHVAIWALLIWVACTDTWGHGDIWTLLLLKVMVGSTVLSLLGFVLLSRVHVANKGHTDAWDIGCNLWPCWCAEGGAATRAMLIWMACAEASFHRIVWSQAAANGHARFCDPTAVWDWVDIHGSCYHT